MKPFACLASANDVQQAALSVIKDVIALVSCSDGSIVLRSRSIVSLQTRMQAAFSLRYRDPLYQAVHEIIIRHASESERLAPGSFETCIEILKDLVWGNKCLELDELSRVGRVPSMGDVVEVLSDIIGPERSTLKQVLLEAVKLAGASGKIVVEKSKNSVTSIELTDGYVFVQRPTWPRAERVDRPRVICIDGYVESVSELHHVLESAAENRTNVIVFVRGMSHDVLHTLKVNHDRGTLSVFPVIVDFDLAGLNTLNDIATVTGADLISSNKGDLISSIRLDSAPTVDSVLLDASQVIIVCKSARCRAQVHSGELQKRLQAETNSDKVKLLVSRIRSMTPRLVIIRLPDSREYAVDRQLIDRSLRAIRIAAERGVTAQGDPVALALAQPTASALAERCCRCLAGLGAVVSSFPMNP